MAVLVFAIVAMALGLTVAEVIRRLPEPEVVELPADPADDSPMQRQLRAEGPKETYAALAQRPWIGPVAVILSGLFGVCSAGAAHGWFGALAVLVAPAMALLTIVDARTRLLPRVVVLPVTVALLVGALGRWIGDRDNAALVTAVGGMALSYVVFFVLWFLGRSGMGFGDVRLAGPLGLLLGSVGWNAWLIGIYAAFISFAVFGVGLMIATRDRGVMRRAYPFGPFLIAGAYAGLVLGDWIHILG